jgi:hypothetical protein
LTAHDLADQKNARIVESHQWASDRRLGQKPAILCGGLSGLT